MPDAITSFTTDIPEKIARDPERAKEVGGAIFVFVVEADDDFAGGTWTVDLRDDPGVTEGAHEAPDCTVTMSHDAWKRVSDMPGSAMALFTNGEINVAGNPMLAIKLQSIIG